MRPERESRPGDRNGLRNAGLCLVAIGFALATVYAAAMIYRSVASSRALHRFDGRRTIVKGRTETVRAAAHTEGEPDPSVWSRNRGIPDIEGSEKASGAPLAVLRFDKQHFRVPVFEGTGESALSRGAGWIESTSRPGGSGNIGIAGHRDSFFRGLKDLTQGDAIELETESGAAVYSVDQIEIVEPSNVGVLRPRPTPSLTLVTCYPFDFVGPAPKRFVVHAALHKPAQ